VEWSQSFLKKNNLSFIQGKLEKFYKIPVGPDVNKFIKTKNSFNKLALTMINQEKYIKNKSENIDLAIIFQRDILDLTTHKAISIVFEEISHFVYFNYKHKKKQNLKPLELELQSEIDIVILEHIILSTDKLKRKLYEKHYQQKMYNIAKNYAQKIIYKLDFFKTNNFTKNDRNILKKIFLSNLNEKIKYCNDY